MAKLPQRGQFKTQTDYENAYRDYLATRKLEKSVARESRRHDPLARAREKANLESSRAADQALIAAAVANAAQTEDGNFEAKKLLSEAGYICRLNDNKESKAMSLFKRFKKWANKWCPDLFADVVEENLDGKSVTHIINVGGFDDKDHGFDKIRKGIEKSGYSCYDASEDNSYAVPQPPSQFGDSSKSQWD